jgi:hypothetical protein
MNPWDLQEGDTADPAAASSEWTQALADPKVRSSLLSFGLQLMQPPSFGQTGAGQFAQAVGAAGEGLTRADAEDRAEREQSRRERDSVSQADRRADQTELTGRGLELKSLQLQMQERDLASKAELRAAQAREKVANLDKIDAQVAKLRQDVALAPSNIDAKNALAAALTQKRLMEADLASVRAAVVAPVAQSQIQRNQAAANLSETRAGAVNSSQELAQRRLDQGDRRITTQERLGVQKLEQQERRDYTTEKTKAQEAHTKENQMQPRARQKEFKFPSMEEWRQSRLSGTGAAPAAPTAATAPAAEAPVAPVAPPAAERKDGTVYTTPRGPLKWNAKTQKWSDI